MGGCVKRRTDHIANQRSSSVWQFLIFFFILDFGMCMDLEWMDVIQAQQAATAAM